MTLSRHTTTLTFTLSLQGVTKMEFILTTSINRMRRKKQMKKGDVA